MASTAHGGVVNPNRFLAAIPSLARRPRSCRWSHQPHCQTGHGLPSSSMPRMPHWRTRGAICSKHHATPVTFRLCLSCRPQLSIQALRGNGVGGMAWDSMKQHGVAWRGMAWAAWHEKGEHDAVQACAHCTHAHNAPRVKRHGVGRDGMGLPRHSMANWRHGMAPWQHSIAQHGMAHWQHGMAWHGTAWNGSLWHSMQGGAGQSQGSHKQMPTCRVGLYCWHRARSPGLLAWPAAEVVT